MNLRIGASLALAGVVFGVTSSVQAWQPVTNGVSATASINRVSGSGQLMALYVSSGTTGLYVSTNAGDGWTRLVNLPGSSSSTLDVLVDNGVIFVARTAQSAGTNAIIMSTNKGASWFGSTNVPVQNFSLLAKDGANVYAAANGSSHVWHSTNSGLNWEIATNSTYNGGTIRALGASGGRLLATTSSGLMLLTGTNWTKLNSDANGANNVRMAAQGGVLLGSSTQANRRAVGLPDGSTNLFNATNGLGEGFVNLSDYYDVVAGPDAAYMVSRQYGSTYTTFLYATTNGGTNWASQPTTGIASASPGSLAVSDRGLFAAFGSSGGLYRVGLTNGQLLVPPTITSNPVANVTVHPGTNITLSAAATSTFPMTLQWQKDGADLPDETNATLNLLNVQTNASGSYRLAAINAGGTNLTTAATVLVIPRTPGWPDLTFNPGGLARDAGGFLVAGTVLQVAALTNNQILVGGQFITVNAVPIGNGFFTGGVPAFSLARLNPDGSADTSFQALPGVSSNGTVRALSVGANGKIFIAGDFKSYNNTLITNLARLNSDGSLDAGFAPASILPANDFANNTPRLLPLADGRLVVMGNFTNINGVARTNLACFNTDGSLDATWPASGGVPFNYTVQDIGPGAGGDVMVAGTFSGFNGVASRKILVSVGTNGAINTNFNHTLNNSVSETELQPGGLLWTAGSFTQHTNNGVATPVVKPVRLASDGRVVSVSPTNLNSPQVLFSQEDAKLIVAFYNAGAGRYQLMRFTATGAMDDTFSSGADFNSSLTSLAMTPSGDLFAAGYFGTVAGANMPGLAKLFAASTNVPPTTPIFTLLPSPSAALPGNNLTLQAAATGASGVGLFWLKDGLPVIDATSGTLLLTNLNAGLAGNYQVIASNSFGSITSAPVSVSVAAAPAITLDLPSATGGSNGATVTLTIAVTGTEPLSYRWYRAGSLISGANGSSHTITNLGSANTTGDYRVIITNAFGSATSTLATVSVGTPPTFFSQPANQTLNGLGNVSLSVIAGASTSFPLTFRWYQNNALIRSWTTNSNLGDTLTISNAVPTNAGSYFVVLSNFAGVATSTVRTVTIRNPYLTSSPQQTSVREGFSTNFTAAATGTTPIDLYWYRRGGAPLATNFLGTGTNLPIVNATRADGSYTYFVMASNVWGRSTSGPVSLIVQIPPAITNISPGTYVVSEINRYVTIWVQHEGQPAPAIYWYKDSVLQPSLLSSQINFPSVQTSNSGTYQLVLSNYLGMATSAPIVLNVQPARGPTITNQPPATRLVSTSGYLNLGVGVDGSPTLYFRWFRDGTPVTGWQSYDVLSLFSPTTNQSGNYTVVVTNNYGSATSTVCAVTVQAPQPANYANKQFVKIADSLTAMPGLGTNRFSGFRDAFLRGGQVWFGGTVSGIGFSVGVYHWSNNVLTSLVNTNANVPGTSSKFTNFYGSTFLSDSKVIFGGNGNDNHTGLYAVTNGSVVTLYDNTTLMPGRPDTFDRFGWPAVSGNQFAFLGFHHYTTNSMESYRAVYVSSNGVLTTLADTNTPLPGIGGTFVGSSSQVGFDGQTVAWWGLNQDTNGGIYRITRTTPIASVSDESVNNPATGLPFDGFISPPNVTTGRVYHVGHDEGFNSVLLYRDAGGPLSVIAKPGDPVPGRALTFDSVGYPFQVSSRSGCFFDGADGAGYYGIFHWNGTTSTKVIDTFDSIDGSPIAYVFVADAEDDCVLFTVTFANGRQALYATLPAGQTFTQWAASYTFPGGLSAPDDDADGDGIPNIFEFYFASNPTNAASGTLPGAVSVNVSGQTYPALTFVRSRNVGGVTLQPQAASDAMFNNLLGGPVLAVTDLGNGTERVTLRSTVNIATQPVQFLRIRLSSP